MEDLSEQELDFFCNELAKQARNDILSAFDAAEAKIHEYPHNELLLLNITIILIPYFCRQPMILYPSIALIQRFQTGIYIWLRAMMKKDTK